MGELTFDVGVGLGEHLQDARVDVLDHVEQILPRGLDVLELCRQEAVALFEGGELLQREGIHLAEGVEVFLRLLRARFLRRTVVRQRRGRDDALPALLGLLVLGDLQRRRRHRDVRAVLGDQIVGRHRKVLENLLLELLDAQRGLRSGDLIAVHGITQGVELIGECRRSTLQRFEGFGARTFDLLELVATRLCCCDRADETFGDRGGSLGDLGRHLRRDPTSLVLASGTFTGVPFTLGGTTKRIGTATHRREALLSGTQRQTRFHLTRTRTGDGSGSRRAFAPVSPDLVGFGRRLVTRQA